MAAKNVKIGVLLVTEDKDGNKRVSLGLGQKGKDPKYNLSVELVVRDSSGRVVAKQTDGFVNLIDPRTHADQLLKAGIITEEVASTMRTRAENIPDKIKYELQVPRLS